MKFKNKWLKEIINEDWSDNNPLEYVENTGWIEDGEEYEYKKTIFRFKDKYYLISENRSGSYYSDYYYESEDWDNDSEQYCDEVEKIAVTKYEWHPVQK